MTRPKYGPKVVAQCCGDTIQSKHRHDFVSCKCGASFVDGGRDYLRMGWAPPAKGAPRVKKGRAK